MENKKENALNQFLGEKINEPNNENENTKKKVLDEREGLIERVDKILVTKDGKQLLREQY
jgi:hypothetical protein